MALSSMTSLATVAVFASHQHGNTNGRVDGWTTAPSRQLYLSIKRWSLDDLSSELLALIFEELRDIDAGSLAAVRRVSRRFEQLATPIAYRRLRLNGRIADPAVETRFPRALARIRAHTRHVEAPGDLPGDGVRWFLDGIERLSSFTWHYVSTSTSDDDPRSSADPESCSSATFWTPADVLGPRHLGPAGTGTGMGTEVHVTGLPLPNRHEGAAQRRLQEVYERGLPAARLASLQLTSPDPPLTTRLDALRRLLARARRLRVLDYGDRGQGTRFDFCSSSSPSSSSSSYHSSSSWFPPAGERRENQDAGRYYGSVDDDGDGDGDGEGGDRMPAFEELALRSYDWDHDARETAARWDFSRLRALRLVDVPAVPFLEAVPPASLVALRVLQCDCVAFSSSSYSPSPLSPPSSSSLSSTSSLMFSAASRDSSSARATHLLATLIRSIRALDELALTCYVRGLGRLVDDDDDDGDGGGGGGDLLLANHASTLRTLRLRDHAGLADPEVRCPSLRPAAVAALSRRLTGLRELELDLDDVGEAEAGSKSEAGATAAFLRALCAFPRLEALTLHVQTAVRPSDYPELPVLVGQDYGGEGGWNHWEDQQRGQWPSRQPDIDYEAAKHTFEALVRGRQQQQMGRRKRGATTTTQWRRIRLVVGGWRPVIGVRRTGEAWRALNRRGVFAERCFVLERVPGAEGLSGDEGGGHLVVREEMARTVE